MDQFNQVENEQQRPSHHQDNVNNDMSYLSLNYRPHSRQSHTSRLSYASHLSYSSQMSGRTLRTPRTPYAYANANAPITHVHPYNVEPDTLNMFLIKSNVDFNPNGDPWCPENLPTLSFHRGDILQILDQNHIYWWYARIVDYAPFDSHSNQCVKKQQNSIRSNLLSSDSLSKSMNSIYLRPHTPEFLVEYLDQRNQLLSTPIIGSGGSSGPTNIVTQRFVSTERRYYPSGFIPSRVLMERRICAERDLVSQYEEFKLSLKKQSQSSTGETRGTVTTNNNNDENDGQSCFVYSCLSSSSTTKNDDHDIYSVKKRKRKYKKVMYNVNELKNVLARKELIVYLNVDLFIPRVGVRRPIVLLTPDKAIRCSFIRQLIYLNPNLFKRPIAHTTRPPRNSWERHGKDYFFVTTEWFEREIERNSFVEYGAYDGHYYGIHRDAILSLIISGFVVLLGPNPASIRNIWTKLFKPFVVHLKPCFCETQKAQFNRNYYIINENINNDTNIDNKIQIKYNNGNKNFKIQNSMKYDTNYSGSEFRRECPEHGTIQTCLSAKIEYYFGHMIDATIYLDDGDNDAFQRLLELSMLIDSQKWYVPSSWVVHQDYI